jgi:quaternary ammonium compound-resistance protein SugE
MAWLWVILGGFMDIGWAIGLKNANGFTSPVPSVVTVVFIAASYVLYAKAVHRLPIGTAYAVFSGIGAAGTVVCGMLFLHEPAEWPRILFILLLLQGILGLKKTDAVTRIRVKPSTRHRENDSE